MQDINGNKTMVSSTTWGIASGIISTLGITSLIASTSITLSGSSAASLMLGTCSLSGALGIAGAVMSIAGAFASRKATHSSKTMFSFSDAFCLGFGVFGGFFYGVVPFITLASAGLGIGTIIGVEVTCAFVASFIVINSIRYEEIQRLPEEQRQQETLKLIKVALVCSTLFAVSVVIGPTLGTLMANATMEYISIVCLLPIAPVFLTASIVEGHMSDARNYHKSNLSNEGARDKG